MIGTATMTSPQALHTYFMRNCSTMMYQRRLDRISLPNFGEQARRTAAVTKTASPASKVGPLALAPLDLAVRISV
ncbi:hypothetical protein EYF80_034626 [Liparis tanakae]|uniref:Uncharacterized protein n=1 Tax=Liparis tanakae TaxID=230148 RepID=A0A4Z2GPH0_9TELE|nr:hypothetical protein EYF80_034626 [Liparis tanakae]